MIDPRCTLKILREPSWRRCLTRDVLLCLTVTILGQIVANHLNTSSFARSFLVHCISHSTLPIDHFRGCRIDSSRLGCSLHLLPDFLTFFINFLSLSVLVIGQWRAMFTVNHWMSGGKYDSKSLVLFSPETTYWFQDGWNWSAMAIFVGSRLYWFVDGRCRTVDKSFLSSLLGGMGLSSYTGNLVAGLWHAWYYKRHTAT